MSSRDFAKFFATNFGLLLLFSACGKGTTQRPSAPSGNIDRYLATEYVSTSAIRQYRAFSVGTSDGTSAATILALAFAGADVSGVSNANLHSAAPIINATCEPTFSSGSSSPDTDSDGIRAEASLTINCPVSDSNIGVEGELTFADHDDNDKYGGFELDIPSIRVTPYSNDLDSVVNTQATVTSTKNSDGSYSGALDYTRTNDGSLPSPGTAGFYLDSKVVPESDGNAIPNDAGQVTQFSGYISRHGNDGDEGTDFDLAVTGTGLVYSSSCSNLFDSGTLTLKDGSQNVIVLTFASCAATATYNGESLTVDP